VLRFLETADDVIALSISVTVTSDDLDSIMDRLDRAMAQHDKVHVYVESQMLEEIQLSGLPAYAARAMPLFGKLSRFGRVAIVADQTWVRTGARIESAMLPFISYRTFTPDQRDRALSWVTGERD
jgi:hypothetical protein